MPGSVVECYELPLDCGACSDTPTPEFSLSPGQLRSLNWGNTCLLRCLVWGIFARVVLLIEVRAWGSGGALGGDRC